MYMYVGYASYTVQSPSEGHVLDNINSVALSFVERLSSLGGSQCIVGAPSCVLCTEVFCTVSSWGHWDIPVFLFSISVKP